MKLSLRRRAAFAVLLAASLSACAAPQSTGTPKSAAAADGVAGEGRSLLMQHRYADASRLINRALKDDPTNADLHFLNGLSYHLQEIGGDTSLRALALVGYDTALKIDPSNANASYCAGIIELENKNYDNAVNRFAQALIYEPENEDTMRAFVAAAYSAHRPDLAFAVSRELERRHGVSDDVLRMEALTAAALNDTQDAEGAARQITAPEERNFVERRLSQWNGFYQRVSLESAAPAPAARSPAAPDDSSGNAAPEIKPFQTASLADVLNQMQAQQAPAVAALTGGNKNSNNGGSASGALAKPADGQEPRSAMVDLIIIQTEENSSLSTGVNLIGLLTATVQGIAATASVSGGGGLNTGTFAGGRSLGGAVTIPATTYSLNIANSGDNKNDILARPTLVVLDQQQSTFYAGFTLTIAIPGSFGGTLTDKSIGLSVTLQPTFLDNDRMLMQVKASRSFFTPVEVNAQGFSQAVEISNVEMNASAAVGMNETLILSGLAERQLQTSRSQVPLLGDIPVVQYLFAQKQAIDNTRTVMFLITPRPAKHFNGELSLSNDDSPQVKALKASEVRWFGVKDTPNYLSVMHHFVSNELYQEYRSGDLLAENWGRPSQIEERLSQVIQLLHF